MKVSSSSLCLRLLSYFLTIARARINEIIIVIIVMTRVAVEGVALVVVVIVIATGGDDGSFQGPLRVAPPKQCAFWLPSRSP